MYVGSYVVPGLDLADWTWRVFFFFFFLRGALDFRKL